MGSKQKLGDLVNANEKHEEDHRATNSNAVVSVDPFMHTFACVTCHSPQGSD